MPEIGKELAYKANREGVEAHFPDPGVRKTLAVDLALRDPSDEVRGEVDLSRTRRAKAHEGQPFARRHAVPGIGQILAWGMLSESQDLARLPRGQDFGSECRVVKCAKESNGNRRGTSGKKLGTVPLRGAFAEAARLFLRQNHLGQDYFPQVAHTPGKAKARTVLAHQLARAVYYRLTREQPVALTRFVAAYPLRGELEPAA